MREIVLIVDDDEDQCELMKTLLGRHGFASRATTSAADALQILAGNDFQVVLSDVGMDDIDGLELCERILLARPDAVVLLVTGRANMETAIAAIRAGAFDFLTKPIDPKHFVLAIDRAMKHRQLSDEVKRLRELAATDQGRTLVGGGEAMAQVLDLIARVGPSDASVLIHGETGTGKELVARALHDASPRRPKPFVAINCAAVPPTLLESELFGHARGAFTDAKEARQGLFTKANGGTLFLDEIGEMPIEMQPKLLRALQERVVRPVGDAVEVPFDARLVVATNRDLEAEVRARRFREDLYYRIQVVRIDVPPLRARGSDILALATHFLKRAARLNGRALSIPVAVADRLMRYDWPGNVRELENCIERAVALAKYDQIAIDDLPAKIRAYRSDLVVAADEPADIVTLDELERRYIVRVLTLLRRNKSRAAQMLGFDRRTLYRKLERYENDAKYARENQAPAAVIASDEDRSANAPHMGPRE